MWGLLPGPPALISPCFGCLAAAREEDVSPQLLQKFEELIPAMGLTKAMLAVLPKSGKCWQGGGARTAPLHGDVQDTAHGVLTPLFAFQQISALQPSGEHGQGMPGVPAGMARAEQGLTAPQRLPACLGDLHHFTSACSNSPIVILPCS